jgi:hypothetical protein
VNLRPVLESVLRLRAPVAPLEPELDDPEYDDQEPELTDEDLAGRGTEVTSIEDHCRLSNEA